MIAARHREREYFANSPEYKHLTSKMGSEHLGRVLSKVSRFVLLSALLLLATVLTFLFLLHQNMFKFSAFGSCHQVPNSRPSVPYQQNYW